MPITSDQTVEVLRAAGEATRLRILALLAREELAVLELTHILGQSQPRVSRHLKVLESAGLIARGREAQTRPCRLEPLPLKALDGWLERYRRFFSDSFDNMDAYLAEIGKASHK